MKTKLFFALVILSFFACKFDDSSQFNSPENQNRFAPENEDEFVNFYEYGYTAISNVKQGVCAGYPDKPDYLDSVPLRKYSYTKRIADADVFGLALNNQRLGHNYSTDQCFNVDGSLLKLAGYPSAILDGFTGEFIRWSNIPSYGRFSNTHPTLTYGTSGNKFVSHDVMTDERVTIFEFEENVSFGYGEGNLDYNDNYVVVNSDTKAYLLDINNQEILSEYELPAGDMDWISISPLGNYIVLNWRPNGSAENQGLKRFELDFSNQVHLTDYTEHSAMGLAQDNSEVYVQYGNQTTWNNDYYLEMVNLTTTEVTPQFYYDYNGNSGIWGGHISMPQNLKGKVLISESNFFPHPTFCNEIFMYILGTNKIKLFGKCYSSQNCRASVSRDGKKAVYTSDYGTGHFEAYVVTQKY